MFKQPFFHSPPPSNSRRRERYSFPKGETLTTSTANAPVFSTTTLSPPASNNNNNNNNPLWPSDGYRFDRTSQHQQQSWFRQSTIRRIHNASWWAQAPRSSGEEEEEYIYSNNVVGKPLWNACSEENSTEKASNTPGWDSKQPNSDNDTVTTVTSLTTSPTSASLFSDVSFIEDQTEDEDTIEFVLDDIDESFHFNDAKEKPNGQTNDDDDDDDDDWSYSTPIQSNNSNHNRSFVVQEVVSATKTETTTTTTTTHTTTTTATTTMDATNNNNILVYPRFFPNKSESSAATKNQSTGLVPKNYYPGSPQRTPMNAQERLSVLTNQPESSSSSSSGSCCASKQRQIEQQKTELQHMNALVTKLCSLLADTVKKQRNTNRYNEKRNQNQLVPLRPSAASFQNKEPMLSTTTARKISSLPITSVSERCPRSKNQRLQVNGEWGTYSGPAISNSKCRAGIWQGCVLRFDNGDLYVGSLSRNDTGSLTLYPPGTLYDTNRHPKRRLR